MNTKRIIQTAAIAVAAGFAAVPAISPATTTQSTVPIKATYDTTLESITGMGAPWTGTLQITISPNGIIQGYYHPADNTMAFIPVTGGLNGDSVWMDIGRSGGLRVNGTLKNGVIQGGAFDDRTDQPMKFTARVSS